MSGFHYKNWLNPQEKFQRQKKLRPTNLERNPIKWDYPANEAFEIFEIQPEIRLGDETRPFNKGLICVRQKFYAEKLPWMKIRVYDLCCPCPACNPLPGAPAVIVRMPEHTSMKRWRCQALARMRNDLSIPWGEAERFGNLHFQVQIKHGWSLIIPPPTAVALP